MARKPKPAATPAKSGPTLFGIGFKAALTVAIGIGLLAALVTLSQRAGDAVADRPRYQVPVSAIECDAPPGTDRAAFLAEVRTIAGLPETVSGVAADTLPLLAAAFARHPWVSDVVTVVIKPDRTIHVALRFRTPALAVRLTGEPILRTLDATGVLLPVSPVPDLLPVLQGEYSHGDPALARAVEIAVMLKDRKPRRIEKTKNGWRVVPESGPALELPNR
jgi:hypothetical protein